MPEKVYYQSSNVLITSTRAEMANRTFVMSNISAVSMSKVSSNPGCAVLLIILGVILGLLGFDEKNILMVIGPTLGFVGFIWYKSFKAEYVVELSSTSGEQKVMQSDDRQTIEEIVVAIKQAIIDNGLPKIEEMEVENERGVMSGDDILQKMKSLKNMLDSNIITTSEYETKKAEILSKM